MANRCYLYNAVENYQDLLLIGESCNTIPLIWCFFFNINNFCCSDNLFIEEQYLEQEDDFKAELSCSVKEAMQNLVLKTPIAYHVGFDPSYFNGENNHNPLVFHPCKKCDGRGFVRVYFPLFYSNAPLPDKAKQPPKN